MSFLCSRAMACGLVEGQRASDPEKAQALLNGDEMRASQGIPSVAMPSSEVAPGLRPVSSFSCADDRFSNSVSSGGRDPQLAEDDSLVRCARVVAPAASRESFQFVCSLSTNSFVSRNAASPPPPGV